MATKEDKSRVRLEVDGKQAINELAIDMKNAKNRNERRNKYRK